MSQATTGKKATKLIESASPVENESKIQMNGKTKRGLARMAALVLSDLDPNSPPTATVIEKLGAAELQELAQALVWIRQNPPAAKGE